MITFTKASKKKSKLRLALYGPSGSGKTFSALRLATGIGGKIALLDSQNASASKYAGRFSFDSAEIFPPFSVKNYVEGIRLAGKAGYSVLVIDSLSHAWKWLLDYVDKIAWSRYRGNAKPAWSHGTPLQDELVQAILESPCHVIATIRTKTEWLSEKDPDGKVRPAKIALSPEQRGGVEYEFDVLMEGNSQHEFTFAKDPSGIFQDKVLVPDESLGRSLAEWFEEGADEDKEGPSESPNGDRDGGGSGGEDLPPSEEGPVPEPSGNFPGPKSPTPSEYAQAYFSQNMESVPFSDKVSAKIAHIDTLSDIEITELYKEMQAEKKEFLMREQETRVPV